MARETLSFEKIGIISKGVDSIADGRLFFIETIALDGKIKKPLIRPPLLKDLGITLNGDPVQISGPVNVDSSLFCPNCNELFKRSLVSHDYQWMYSILYCKNHALKVLLDLFPKIDSDTTHNWLNSFRGFDLQTDLPPGVMLEPYLRPDERYLELKKALKPSFYLTPDGLEPIEELNSQEKIRWFPHLFGHIFSSHRLRT